ncbi:MAG: hypothetical protein RLZ98_3460 [Pseudomonadota bacterium]
MARTDLSIFEAKYLAHIGNDQLHSRVTIGCKSAEEAAKAARAYAKFGEVITVIGPRKGVTKWEAVGTGPLATVWPLAK